MTRICRRELGFRGRIGSSLADKSKIVKAIRYEASLIQGIASDPRSELGMWHCLRKKWENSLYKIESLGLQIGNEM
jgi:hypothetical protein